MYPSALPASHMETWASLPSHTETIVDLKNTADLDQAHTLIFDFWKLTVPALGANLAEAASDILTPILVGAFEIDLILCTTLLLCVSHTQDQHHQ